VIVACLGDSITAGSPLWDPDPAVRAGIDEPDERSQWQWWAARAAPQLEFRNYGVYGQRTDEIAARFAEAVGDSSARSQTASACRCFRSTTRWSTRSSHIAYVRSARTTVTTRRSKSPPTGRTRV
jgi:hypothetical protein